MEQVPVIRDNMVQRCNWVEEATYSLQEIFGKANDRDDKGLQALADLYAGMPWKVWLPNKKLPQKRDVGHW